MEITIRQYKDQDKDSIKKCIGVLKEFESQFDPGYLTTQESVEELFKGLIDVVEKGNGVIFVAIDKLGSIAGFVSLEKTLKNSPEIVKKIDAIYVSDIVVLPEFRSKGVGESLLKKAEEYTNSLGINYIKLIVFAKSDRVRSFYERAGFVDYEITMIKQLKD